MKTSPIISVYKKDTAFFTPVFDFLKYKTVQVDQLIISEDGQLQNTRGVVLVYHEKKSDFLRKKQALNNYRHSTGVKKPGDLIIN